MKQKSIKELLIQQITKNLGLQIEDMLQLCNQIEKLLNEKERVMIAIDGNSAAGKTTLAILLQSIFECNLIHVDEFFLKVEQRTEQRLSMPGGNVDYERFQYEVLNQISRNKPFYYRPYDCGSQTLSKPILVQPCPLNIVEGVYSMHPHFGDIYDLKIFLSLDADEQKRRIFKRNGQEKFERFINEWIPMENKYFEAYQIKSKCDRVFE